MWKKSYKNKKPKFEYILTPYNLFRKVNIKNSFSQKKNKCNTLPIIMPADFFNCK